MIVITFILHNSFSMLNVFHMTGFDTVKLSLREFYRLVFIFLVQARAGFIAILKECHCGWMYLLKARWFYILTTLVFVISAPSVECSSFSIISCEERMSTNITGSSAVDVGSDSDRSKNGVLGTVMEHPLHGGNVSCSYDNAVVILRGWPTGVCNVPDGSGKISFGQRYNHGFMGTKSFQTDVSYGQEPATCTLNHILQIVNVLAFVSKLAISYFQNICSAYILILRAPWFRFIILLGLIFRLSTTIPTSQKKVSRFRLLVRLRMALGRLRVQRLSYVELLNLRKSHACLQSLESPCGIAQERLLSGYMANASLGDLSYFSCASDIMSVYVGQVIAKRNQEVKKERLRKRRLRYCKTDSTHCDIIYTFLLIILILSLFEKSEESQRNIILYGVPGLPNVSISQNETYSTVRKEILEFAPNLSNFYFVHRGLIIKDEDVGIDWGNGHVILNVHSRGDLKGGTKKDKRKRRGQSLTDDVYTPESEVANKRKKWRSRKKAARSRENSKRTRTAEQIKRHNAQRTAEQIKRQNAQRTAEQIKRQNDKRGLKNDISCKEYDASSPFPPTEEQVHYCGRILSNSIAALFAQQAPPPEISYALVVSEELRLFSKPIIDFTMYQFRQECCFNVIGSVNLAKAAANKALSTLDKILVLNDHYQLMSDFNVWDVYNPPSLKELNQLATRHPFQPISALLRKEVHGHKNDIHLRLKTIITHRQSNSGSEERLQSEDGGACVSEIPPLRYWYPHQDDYLRFENNVVFDVMGGQVCEQSNSREFKICMNELVAFHINSEAKFIKVYTEGVSKCFLMPAEFKDEAMRKFFQLKFEQFRTSGSKLSKKVANINLVGVQTEGVSEEADFCKEHLERRKAQEEYLRRHDTDNVHEAEAESGLASDEDVRQSDGESLIMTDGDLVDSGSIRGNLSSIFNSEVQRAQKYFIDAREVCLIHWDLRDRTVDLMEVLCTSIKEMVSGNHGACQCRKENQICKMYSIKADQYLQSLRDANRELEDWRPISQCLDDTLLSLQNIHNRLKEFVSSREKLKVDKEEVINHIDELLQFWTLMGTHSTSLFNDKNKIYEKLKSTKYGICCTCGIRSPYLEGSGELKDAISFKQLHRVDDDEVAAYEALKEDDEDELGALAQEAFHIAYVKSEKRYYHLLNIEHPTKDNPLENSCCLIKGGELTKLPSCDECYDRMKKASNYLKEVEEMSGEPSCKELFTEPEDQQPTAREKAIGMLKRLSFKRCDLGRIPRSLGKLSSCGRTAIAPFIAYTIIRQLHSSKQLPDSSQHSTKGSKFSVPSEEIGGKEFVIPLSHEEFVNSFKTELPREDVAVRH